ncbi:bifunctional adenosylcobinamide kinase/adenosylcobinamide-phosphate guanylyltransferase, partial [Cribrihabitans sp. XS_ASV171]
MALRDIEWSCELSSAIVVSLIVRWANPVVLLCVFALDTQENCGWITSKVIIVTRILTLVLGGAASGKSAWAEEYVANTGKPRLYLATSQVFDREMREKVDLHVARRGSDWRTVEAH